MKKKTKQIAEDNRSVAIYARKSRITNKGDSIGVQFKQCAEYAIRELSLDDDYTFINYEDKGLSGYYSDRPDFQRMLHDIEMGKIRAVVCYKLDRIGRKTTDLLRLLDFLEKHKVDENDERYCHIFIKGCTKEDYDEFFRATGYISGTREKGTITSKLHLCDSDECCKNNVIFTHPFCM